MFGLDLGTAFPHVFCTMCDTWRRLSLPSQRGWVQLLGTFFTSVEDASNTLQGLAMADRPCCHGDDCTRVALAVTNQGTDLAMVEELLKLFGEALYHLPASSVNVEKLHANTQILCAAHKAGRKPATIQQNTYIMSCSQEHQKFKEEVMSETCGKVKLTSARLLHQRCASTTMPSKPVTHVKQARGGNRTPRNVAILGISIHKLSVICQMSWVSMEIPGPGH